MNRVYCVECREFMVKEKTGFTVSLSGSVMHVRGDLYRCPRCKKEVYGDFGEPFEVQPKKGVETEETRPERLSANAERNPKYVKNGRYRN